MRAKHYIAIVASVLAAVLLPAAISYELAERQSLSDQGDALKQLAVALARRTDETGDQIHEAVIELNSGKYGPKGSDQEVARMRYLGLTLTYLQTVGRMSGTKVLSTSMGVLNPPADLGPPSVTTQNGVHIWRYVRPRFAGGAVFHVVEADGVAGFIAPELIFDVYSEERDLSMGIVTAAARMPLTLKGKIDPEWLVRLGNRNSVEFQSDGRLVAEHRCSKVDIVAVVSQPATPLAPKLLQFAVILVPLGAIIGALVALKIVDAVRRQSEYPFLLRRAIAERQLLLHYQPIVELETGRMKGAEALVRWRRPTGEMVSPAVFVPVAEEAGLLPKITDLVIDMVMPALREAIDVNSEFYIGMNLSSADVRSGRIPGLLRSTSAQFGVPLAQVEVEITETGMLSGQEDLAQLANIRETGVKIAMDDFGTGYSSLAYLLKLDVDVLKIDKLFVDAIGTLAVTSGVIDHMIRMANELHKDVIAEGVETQQQADYLQERGVKFGQGYLFAKPMPLEDLLDRLRRET